MNKLSKSDYHNDLIPAFIAYRKAMEESCNVFTSHYLRKFTEKRTYGARSKYWLSSDSIPFSKMETYIQKNPIFTTASGKMYSLELRSVRGSVYYTQRPDVALFCNLIN